MSKYSNFRLTLRPGLPAEPMTGRAAVPGLYVKFENGVAQIPEYGINGISKEEIIEMMKQHPSFDTTFHLIEDEAIDPYAGTRKPVEPEHRIYEMKYGAVTGVIKQKPKLNLDPSQMKMVEEMAKKMAVEIASKMVNETMQDKNKETDGDDVDLGEAIKNEIEEKTGDVIEKRGRPKKNDSLKRI